MALIVLAPFEAIRPLLTMPGQSLTSTEAILLAVLAIWVAACAFGRVDVRWRTPLTTPWVTLIAVMLVAAMAAPVHRGNALNMVGRLALAFATYLLAVNAVTSESRLRGTLVISAAGGLGVATLVLLDYADAGLVRYWLSPFRAGIAAVGSEVRASGPFQYPTIAAMYLEILFALGLALVPMAVEAGRPLAVAAAGVALVPMAQAVALTFTRAGLLALLASLAFVTGLRAARRGPDRAVGLLVGMAVLVVVQFGASRSSEAVRLRLTTESRETWYRATVDAPQTIELPAGGSMAVPVTVTNAGRLTWQSTRAPRFLLSYHWLLSDSDRVVSWEGLRTAFQGRVAPGESVSMVARVEAPPGAGVYRLLWDVEQEGQLWFSTEPEARLFMSRAVVTGPSAGRIEANDLSPLPRNTVRPGRLALWGAAARMIADRPLLGVGPDNFRLLYGSYAKIENPDTRVHSNNMYVEMFMSGGLIGGLAFIWLCWSAAQVCGRMIRSAGSPLTASAAGGVTAAIVAIGLHGFFDSFFAFTATYTLIAITLGIAVATTGLDESRHADRV